MIMKNTWTLNIDEDFVAWLTFDTPGERVNTFTEASLRELERLLDELAGDAAIQAVVIKSAKHDSFIVGADISELAEIATPADALAKSRAGHAVFDKLASLSAPTVAAIHGTCLGGGLEIALACDYRTATDHPKTSIGLPEVGLGIIPGWGGTQRLPRVIGLVPALNMILTGKPLKGRKAYRIGLADGLFNPSFLEEQTRRFIEQIKTPAGARTVLGRRRSGQTRMMRLLGATPLTRQLVYRRSARRLEERTKGNYPAPAVALSVIRRTYRRRDLAAGLAIEAEAFSELACTPISRNLIGIFQASQRLKKNGIGPEKFRPAQRVGVVGAGIMGSGIAWACSHAGLPVRLKDIDWDALGRGMAAAAGMYEGLLKRRKITDAGMNLCMHRISPTVDYRGFEALDAVIEAVIEDADLKKQVLREIEARCDRDALICTNTSSLPLHELAGVLENPRRFVGLHFFNPVNRMPLVEVVGGSDKHRSAETVAGGGRARQDASGRRRMRGGGLCGVPRQPDPAAVPRSNRHGCSKRAFEPQRHRHGCWSGFGMPMGPLALADEVGLDVGFKVAKVLEDAYGEAHARTRGVLGAVAQTAGSFLGRKSGGRGFYRVPQGPAGSPIRQRGTFRCATPVATATA